MLETVQRTRVCFPDGSADVKDVCRMPMKAFTHLFNTWICLHSVHLLFSVAGESSFIYFHSKDLYRLVLIKINRICGFTCKVVRIVKILIICGKIGN